MRTLSIIVITAIVSSALTAIAFARGMPVAATISLQVVTNAAVSQAEELVSDAESRGLWNEWHQPHQSTGFIAQLYRHDREDSSTITVVKDGNGTRKVHLFVPEFRAGLFPVIINGKCEQGQWYEIPCSALKPERWKSLYDKSLTLTRTVAGL